MLELSKHGQVLADLLSLSAASDSARLATARDVAFDGAGRVPCIEALRGAGACVVPVEGYQASDLILLLFISSVVNLQVTYGRYTYTLHPHPIPHTLHLAVCGCRSIRLVPALILPYARQRQFRGLFENVVRKSVPSEHLSPRAVEVAGRTKPVEGSLPSSRPPSNPATTFDIRESRSGDEEREDLGVLHQAEDSTVRVHPFEAQVCFVRARRLQCASSDDDKYRTERGLWYSVDVKSGCDRSELKSRYYPCVSSHGHLLPTRGKTKAARSFHSH